MKTYTSTEFMLQKFPPTDSKDERSLFDLHKLLLVPFSPKGHAHMIGTKSSALRLALMWSEKIADNLQTEYMKIGCPPSHVVWILFEEGEGVKPETSEKVKSVAAKYNIDILVADGDLLLGI